MDVSEQIHDKAKSMLTDVIKSDILNDPDHSKKVTENVLDLYTANEVGITIDVLVLITIIRTELRIFTSVLD